MVIAWIYIGNYWFIGGRKPFPKILVSGLLVAFLSAILCLSSHFSIGSCGFVLYCLELKNSNTPKAMFNNTQSLCSQSIRSCSVVYNLCLLYCKLPHSFVHTQKQGFINVLNVMCSSLSVNCHTNVLLLSTQSYTQVV